MAPTGDYEVRLVGEKDTTPDFTKDQWVAFIANALTLQRARGGGVFVVVHPTRM